MEQAAAAADASAFVRFLRQAGHTEDLISAVRTDASVCWAITIQPSFSPDSLAPLFPYAINNEGWSESCPWKKKKYNKT